MSIQSEIKRLKQAVSDAFTAIGNKGGTVPSSKVSGNLATAIQSIPSGVTVKAATGTITANGNYEPHINVNCGFSPDVVFIHLPDIYTEGGVQYPNDMAAYTANAEFNKMICCWSSIGEMVDDTFTLAFAYIQKTENGFIASAFGEQSLSGDYWYTTKTYGYTAIKYT